MTRLALIALFAGALLGGCDKPKPEDCRKALLNMQHLLGTENLTDNATLEGEVRRCRGGSKRKAVECAEKATTLDELKACDFYQMSDKNRREHGPAPMPGGAQPRAGSAGPSMGPGGSTPAGSTAPVGSAAPAGSAADPNAAPAGSAAAPAGSAGSAK